MSIAIGLALRFGRFLLGNRMAQVAMLVIAAYAYGQWQGRSAAWDRCEARVKAEVAAEQTRQQNVGAKVMARLKADLDRAEADETAAQQALLKFEADIAARPPIEGCAISKDDADEINR